MTSFLIFSKPKFKIGAGIPNIEDKDMLNELLELLDGSHTTGEVIGSLISKGYEFGKIFKTLEELTKLGLIVESDEASLNLSAEEREIYKQQMEFLSKIIDTSYGSAVGIEGQYKLKSAAVVIVGSGFFADYLAHYLEAVGIGNIIIVGNNYTVFGLPDNFNKYVRRVRITDINDIDKDAYNEMLLIYVPETFDVEYAEKLNKYAISNSLPYIIFKNNLFDIEIGPLIIPYETACYTCYKLRREAINSPLSSSNIPRPNLPIGIDLLALEILKFFTHVYEPITQGRLWKLNLLNGKSIVLDILKLPRCPSCGVHKVKPTRKLWEL